MSFALGAVILIILLLPPVVFYQLLIAGQENDVAPYLRKLSLTEKLLGTALISLFIHAIAITILSAFYSIRFDVILELLGLDKWKASPDSTSTFYCTNKELQWYIIEFGLYNLVLNGLAAGIGYGVGKYYKDGLDILKSKWYFVFTGRVKTLSSSGQVKMDFDIISIDAVVNTSDGTMIYSGFFVDFDSDDEDLDRIHLCNVFRKEFKKTIITGDHQFTTNLPGDPVPIPSDVFIIKYEHIINLNIRFIKIPEDKSVVEALPTG